MTLRPVLLQDKPMFQAEFHYEKKAIHENLAEDEALEACAAFILRDFKQINIFTEEEDVQLLAAKPDRPRIIRKPATLRQESLSITTSKIIPSLRERPATF